MAYRKILVISDNQSILDFFIKMIGEKKELKDRSFDFICGPSNDRLGGMQISGYAIKPFDIKRRYNEVIERYDLVISAHCKQLFPAALVEQIKCINVHPGLNPYNRGWFPQVFSILNGLPLGATIHEIDVEIDHGGIIAQREVPVYAWDTSLTTYNRVQAAEEALLRENIAKILSGEYETFQPGEEGNLNLKKDFEKLREIKLNESLTFQQAIDKLRALTHPPYKNAYFIDPKTGEKVSVQIILQKDTPDVQEE